MTRTELKAKANRLMRSQYWPMEQVNNCKCWVIWSPDKSVAIIQSYRTAVAIYNDKSHTMYVFDFYSHTSQQHIRKAAKIIGCVEIRYLYQRSDSNIICYPYGWRFIHRVLPSERKYIIKYDWLMYIESEWNY